MLPLRRCITPKWASLPATSALLNSSTHSISPSSRSGGTVSASVLGDEGLRTDDVVLSFSHWFKSRKNPLFDHIFKILGDDERQERAGFTADLALSQLGLRLSESLVLEVLNYGKDVLSCLKFFHWAGRQPGFYHTRVTFFAIFKILSRFKLMYLMEDLFADFWKPGRSYNTRLCSVMVMGYAVAGKPEVALQLFGKMRFQGIDLDTFAYHVLLNALVEEGCFDAAEVIAKQIAIRGLEGVVTRTILLKSLCKQRQLDKAEFSLRGSVSDERQLNGHSLGVLVDALCKDNQFEKAGKLLDEFCHLGIGKSEHAYGVWLRNLVQAGKLDGALEFLQSKKSLEGYVPDVFRYNMLICRLLRENRLEEVCDLLMEMSDRQILPDDVTMNAALCFFCKSGMVDVALELYNKRTEFGLTPNSLAFNYLVNTLCGDGSIDEAYQVLKNSIYQGYFPGKKVISILASALFREGKLEKMKELVIVDLELNLMPTGWMFNKLISALCMTGKVKDGYLIYGELNRLNKVVSKTTYGHLIHGFNKLKRGDISAGLLIEMQEKGLSPTQKLFRAVIQCLCDMENPEKQFLKLLDLQLSRHGPSRQVYNNFIDGAKHARRPELATEVFEMMVKSGIAPDLTSDNLMLQSYLSSGKISNALNFLADVSKRREIGTKLYGTMIVGLCKANKPGLALEFLGKMRENKKKPSRQCYEEILKLLCDNKKYSMAVNLIQDVVRVGQPVSSFMGNVLLLHSLKSQHLYRAWVGLNDLQNGTSSTWMLEQLIAKFSSRTTNEDFEVLEEAIKQCFPLDLYTYNILLRKLSMRQMEHACELFNRLSRKGYEPNEWTYGIIVQGFFKHGRTADAQIWIEQMLQKGFDPNKCTKRLI